MIVPPVAGSGTISLRLGLAQGAPSPAMVARTPGTVWSKLGLGGGAAGARCSSADPQAASIDRMPRPIMARKLWIKGASPFASTRG